MDRGLSLRTRAAGLLVLGTVVAVAGSGVSVLGIDGETVGFGLLAAGLALAVAADEADGDRRATLLLALAGGCFLLSTRNEGAARYGLGALGVVAAAAALYEGTLANEWR
ncbi:MAG: hypothetical protein ABEJ05_03515 [Haloglomus sp.]